MTRLRISIITPSYNQAQFIERTIASVLCQSGPFDLEYLVFDGGSTDGTLEILRKYHDHLSWQSALDSGQIDAINTGLSRATGEVVGWLNSDDTLAPGALAKVAAVFTQRPEVEWVHGRCDIIDPDDRIIRPRISAYKHWRCLRYSYARLLTENFISQMTVFWRRRMLEETGLLDMSLSLAFDYDLWLRFGKRSDPFYIPERLASFRWYETSKSGAHMLQQLAEDHLVARRHGLDGWLQWRKRLKAAQRLTVYHLLR
jgi:glycosyltransferase involved in cell wall biosynthesis